jgi:ubiquinone/menaquinone biosynthesis C-methylase UbiE
MSAAAPNELNTENSNLKDSVRAFWDRASCGEVYLGGGDRRAQFEAHARARYELEPWIHPFARFDEGRDRDVLEVGVGLGADHVEWATAGPRSLTGIDLTPRAVAQTRERLELFGLTSRLLTGDAEHLPFDDASFDVVYSYGVLHHTPDTPAAIREVARVLRPGGTARIMIYHAHSLVGAMLWTRYALLRGRPGRSLREVYAEHLESPGTKAYTVDEARAMFAGFRSVHIESKLGHGDLLEGAVGQRHGGVALTVARRMWPRRLIKRALKDYGLGLLIDAVK